MYSFASLNLIYLQKQLLNDVLYIPTVSFEQSVIFLPSKKNNLFTLEITMTIDIDKVVVIL